MCMYVILMKANYMLDSFKAFKNRCQGLNV